MNTQPEMHRLHSLAPPNVPDHKVLRCIGSGSYGEVWLAQHASGAYRAVKFVSREMFQRDRPFEREFTGMLKYEGVSRAHEGLVDVLQVGRDDTVFFYVMELGDDAFLGREIQAERYIPKTLGTEIKHRGRLPFAECLQVGLSLTSALGHLHQHGLVHRDVKPANVIFGNGQPKLADIGLVADVHEARSYVGTEGFIPPEGPGTAQADLFALGKTMYEMATGKDRKEFPGLPIDLAGSQDHERLLEFNEVILKACANDSSARYQTAAEMLSDLALLQSGKSVRHARALEHRLETAKKLGRVAAIVALLAAVGYFFAQIEARRARKAERTANDHLIKAYLAQARAGRISGVSGQRVESLKAIAAAAKLQPSMELRNEAVAALALVDLEDWYWRERPVNHVAFDPALERYAVGNGQGEIAVYRVGDDAELMRFVGSKSGERYFQFSPDGRFLAATFGSGRLMIWNVVTRALMVNAKFGSINWGRFCVFSPDGRAVGIRTPEPRIAFFDLTTGAELESLALDGPAGLIALRPDGQMLAVRRDALQEVELWDLKSRTLQGKLTHAVPVESAAWHSDGRRLAVGGWSGHLYLWDTESTNRLELHGHTGVIPNVFFDHRGTMVVSSSWDGTTRFWDAGTGKQLLTSYAGYAMEFSADDQRLAYRREGLGFGIWYMHASGSFRTFAGPIGSAKPSPSKVDMSSDGRWLLLGTRDAAQVWDFASQRLVHSQPQRNYSAHFAPNGRSFITVSLTDVRQWPVMGGEDHSTFTVGPPKLLMTLSANPYPYVTVTRGERKRITVLHARGILAFDLDEPSPIPLIESKGLQGYAATSPDTNWLALSLRTGPTEIWDLRRHEMVFALGREYGGVAFSPDGRWLVVGSGASYSFYETGSWRRRHVIQTHTAATGTPANVAFSRDGQLAALAVNRRLVQIVEPATGREIITLNSPEPEIIASVAFSPDDTTLLVANDQQEVHVWDLRALRRELAALNLDWKQ
jgi:WD40 repeat protein